MREADRPNPDELLKQISDDEKVVNAARLRIFLGMSAGVGKTYAMLKAAHQRKDEGFDVVVGVVETHGRTETAEQLEGLEVIPRLQIDYRGTQLQDMDLDAILKRRPQLVIVDELAHTNIPTLRHAKRYQDVLELLDAGIDVYTALNVQHLESRKDNVEAITQIPIRETVPDSILERATQVELVDIAPVELLKRLKEGKVYLGDKAERAAQNFFKEDKLTALREIALRLTAERVDHDLQKFVINQVDKTPWQTNERLMVAISHSPFSEKLIRATRRLAYNLEAPWIAVYIDTGLSLNNEDQAQLAKNLNLARELKAEVISTIDTDVPMAIRRIARQKNVTQVLVGRPTRRWLRDIVEGGTLLDRLVRESVEIDVHVIRQDGVTLQRHSIFNALKSIRLQTGFVRYLNAFWFLGAVAVACGFLENWIGYRAVGFVFLLAVMVVGMVGSLGPVVFAAILSALTWNYFFIPPRLTFILRDPDDIFLSVTYLAAAMIMGYLTTRIRFHEKLIREREERTNVLYEVLKDIASSREKSEFLTKTLARLSQILNAECGIFLADRDGKLQFEFDKPYAISLDEKAQAVATWAFQSQKPAGWSTDTLSEAVRLYIPLKGSSGVLGVFAFKPSSRRQLGTEKETLLYSVVAQLSVSLERHFFEKRLQDSRRLQESEKLHQTLLNSISHEMRTPLAAMIGWASSLADAKSAQDPKFVQQAAAELIDNGDRLNRVIENLLDMSRLNSGALGLQLDWHDLQDLVGVTLKKLEKNLAHHAVRADLPTQLPLVRIDFRFMEHALSNLLLNAVAYTPVATEIVISVSVDANEWRLAVDDQGPGIPAASRDSVFEKFYRIPGTPTGGTGLGLSIVKSIVEAHGGWIRVTDSALGGARFEMGFSIVEAQPSLTSAEARVTSEA